MNVDGLNNGSVLKTDLNDRSNRADRADRSDRSGQTQRGTRADRADGLVRPQGESDIIETKGKGGDQIETAVTGFIQNVVDQAIQDLADHLNEVTTRREELLAKADDPQAIRRAARGFLEGETSEVGKL